MDNLPAKLPATITRDRPMIQAVMGQSLHEQGPSRTAAAWRWVVTGHGPAPVSGTPGTGNPPGPDEIEAEAIYPPPQAGSELPWRYAFDKDPDRQQARRVLRWITGAADAIPLLDLNRGRYAGARLYLARTDEQLRQVRGWAELGLSRCDLPSLMPRWQAEHPWKWEPGLMNAAWLRGAVAYLDWILGDTTTTPITRQRKPVTADPDRHDPKMIHAARSIYGVAAGRWDIEEEIYQHAHWGTQQGHSDIPVEPDEYPPPQWCEGVEQAHDWATGEDPKPPADHHGCGDYTACPATPGRCSCEAAGHCLQDQCPACTGHVCNAG